MKGANALYADVTSGGRFRANGPKAQTTMSYHQYYRVLRMLAEARFQWDGLPEEIDERYLERRLHANGLVVFTYDDAYRIHVALEASPAGDVDMYGNPLSYHLNGNGKFTRTVTSRDCVPIWANTARTPDNDIVAMYANRLAQVDRTVDINLTNTRTPLIFAIEPSEQLSAENFYKSIADGDPAIFTVKTGSAMSIGEKILPVQTSVHPQTVTENLAARRTIWNDAMMMLGIQAAPPGKKERMVSDEANSLDGQTMAFRGLALAERERACEKINKKYGLDVSVTWRLTEGMTAGFVGNTDIVGMAGTVEDLEDGSD